MPAALSIACNQLAVGIVTAVVHNPGRSNVVLPSHDVNAVTIGDMSDHANTEQPVSHGTSPGDRRQSSWPLVAVLVIAVAALGLSGWGLLRTMNSPGSATSETTYTDAQRVGAKTKICVAFDTVRRGVSQNTNLQPPGGPADLAGSLAVAANARLSLYDGGQYLIARTDPATPQDLADAVRSFANTLMDVGAAATAGAQNTEPAQAARLRDADAANTTIAGLCR